MKRVSKSQLKHKITIFLKSIGFSKQEVNAIVSSWEYASLSEKYSHGFDRVTWLTKMVKQKQIIPNSPLKISTGLITHIEGNMSLGYLAAEEAVHSVITAANKFGIGIATISNCYPTGCMGQYTEKITQAGQIGIAISHSPPRVAAYGTVDKIFGTMGHSFGFPSKKIPYIYDSSIGAITNGAIIYHHATNTLFPENTVFTKNGKVTINPSDVIDEDGVFNGIIAIAGDRHAHKLSGFAGSLELLTRLALIKESKDTDAYSFFMTLNPVFFENETTYRSLVTELENNIKNARKQKGISNVYFAGQRSYCLRQKNANKKTIQISNNTYQLLF